MQRYELQLGSSKLALLCENNAHRHSTTSLLSTKHCNNIFRAEKIA